MRNDPRTAALEMQQQLKVSFTPDVADIRQWEL
jgi:hypothetical protein